MLNKEQNEVLWKLVKPIKTGVLVTVDNDARAALHARPMHLAQDNLDEGKLYFYSWAQSAKTHEIKEDAQVNVSFSDVKEDVYVSFCGTAQVTRDQALIEKYWNPFVAAWYPEGKEDVNLSMIVISIESAEYWDSDQSAMRKLYEVAKANVTHTLPDMGVNRKFGS